MNEKQLNSRLMMLYFSMFCIFSGIVLLIIALYESWEAAGISCCAFMCFDRAREIIDQKL